MSLTDQLAYYEMEADAIKKVAMSFVLGQRERVKAVYETAKYFYYASYGYSRSSVVVRRTCCCKRVAQVVPVLVDVLAEASTSDKLGVLSAGRRLTT